MYVSVDIEADGPTPSQNNLLSIGAAKFDQNGQFIDSFQVNLLEREDGKADPNTMREFWDKNPKAWKASRENAVEPNIAMYRFDQWLDETNAKPLFVGYPVTYDFMWIYDYSFRYLGYCPFGFQGIDIKTAASLAMNIPFHLATKRRMPSNWFNPHVKHTHVAREDAIEQGYLWISVLEAHGTIRKGI